MTPLYVSCFTIEYAPLARELVDSLDRFGLEHELEGIPDLGSWVRNTQQKPEFLLRMRGRHPDQPLVWLDADARVMRQPALFDELRCDLAAHFIGGREPAAGTLYLGPGPVVDEFLEAWIGECRRQPDANDQPCFRNVLERRKSLLSMPLKIDYLPPQYLAIFDAGMCAEHEVVILHNQASRKARAL